MNRSEHKAAAEDGFAKLDVLGDSLGALLSRGIAAREDINTAVASLTHLAQRTGLHIQAAAIKDWDRL